jgi:hypothetical protein
MEKTFILFVSMLFLIGCKEPKKKDDLQDVKSLNQLVEQLNYFELQKKYSNQKNEISEKYQLYFESILANAFNRPEKSNDLIDKFFGNSKEYDTISKKLLQVKLTNHIYLSEYDKAKQVNEVLQQQYIQFLDSVELEDLKNTHKIWQALKDVPPQKIIKKRDVKLPIIKDKARLSTVATKFGDSIKNFVFDTGANFSVIQRSVAQALGMKLIPANFNVEAVTGMEVKSDLAIAKKTGTGHYHLKKRGLSCL